MVFLIGEILICLLIAFILGFVIGWLLKGIFCKDKVSQQLKPARPKELEKIEGIGPQIAQLLIKSGIMDIDDLSKTSVSKLENILDSGGKKFSVANPSTWPEQATLFPVPRIARAEALQSWQSDSSCFRQLPHPRQWSTCSELRPRRCAEFDQNCNLRSPGGRFSRRRVFPARSTLFSSARFRYFQRTACAF